MLEKKRVFAFHDGMNFKSCTRNNNEISEICGKEAIYSNNEWSKEEIIEMNEIKHSLSKLVGHSESRV